MHGVCTRLTLTALFYSRCSYVDVEGKQLVAADDMDNSIELGGGGSELVITSKSEKGRRVTTLGSREFIRYYRQKPRPSVAADRALALSLASRSESCIFHTSIQISSSCCYHKLPKLFLRLNCVVVSVPPLQLQEHGFGDCPVQGADGEAEGPPRDEQERGGDDEDQDRDEEQRDPEPAQERPVLVATPTLPVGAAICRAPALLTALAAMVVFCRRYLE